MYENSVKFQNMMNSIVAPELNFDSVELLSGKKIAFLYISLAAVADFLFVKMRASKLIAVE